MVVSRGSVNPVWLLCPNGMILALGRQSLTPEIRLFRMCARRDARPTRIFNSPTKAFQGVHPILFLGLEPFIVETKNGIQLGIQLLVGS